MTVLKLRKIGNSVGVILPKDVLLDLNVKEGEVVHLHKSGAGFMLRASQPDFDRKVEAARYVMHKRFEALRELAK
ncbi:MAG: AbrB/MazE/SpoVT family DNA-binding domain-containing protein [Bosea sp. (in: a-proteobacteria)]